MLRTISTPADTSDLTAEVIIIDLDEKKKFRGEMI